MESQKQLIMDKWLIMNINDSIVGMHYAVMDIRNLKFTMMSIIQSWLSIIQNYGLNLRISIIVNGWSDIWMYGKPKSSDYGYPWLIMNIHDSIVGIHNSVMDIRNLIFVFLNYHLYP